MPRNSIDDAGETKINKADKNKGPISIRPVPYPYRAMLSICSDLDETPDKQVYFETMKYLNTTKETSFGQGVGLETGNTIYFDMPPEQFSYWNTDEEGRTKIRALIKSGHIDCLHSYGDLATTRAHAERALNELEKYSCSLEVWIDHSVAPTNFGKDIMRGRGDVKNADAYHADLTTEFGVKYVWMGRVTSVIGQNAPRTLRGIWYPPKPFISARTVLKEFTKGMYAALGNTKYTMHGPNQILRETKLRSGQKVFEFMRSTFHWGGISYADDPVGLAEVLREDALSRLIKHEGISIIYTHLGKFKNNCNPFCSATKNALFNLSRYFHDGKILVTTTHRILRYCAAIGDVKISAADFDDSGVLNIRTSLPQKALEGLTLYVPAQKVKKILLNGNEVTNIGFNPPDHTGKSSISFPWSRLEFPEV